MSAAARLRAAAAAALGEWAAAVQARLAGAPAVAGLLPDPTLPVRMGQAWTDALLERVGPALTAAIEAAHADALRGSGLTATGPVPGAERLVAGLAARWAGIPPIASAWIERTVVAGTESGADAAGLHAGVLALFGAGDTWTSLADRIARTEATGAVALAQTAAWSRVDAATGSVTRKRWVAADDAREAHRAAHGQTVPLDARFVVGGEELAHPGDPAGSAANTTFCRCSLEAVVDVPAAAEAAPAADAQPDAALLAAGGDTTMTKARTWSGLLAPFGVNSGDRRRLKAGGEFTFRELPLPLMFQEATGSGHSNAVVVGRILAIDVTDGGYEASGDYLVGEEFAEDVARAVALNEAGLGHVSVDLSEVAGEMSDAEGNPITEEDFIEAWLTGAPLEVYDQFTAAKLMGVTQVAKPAFEVAKIALDAAEEGVESEAPDGGDQAAAGTVEAAEVAADGETVETPGGEVEAGAAEAVVAEAQVLTEAAAVVDAVAVSGAEQIASLQASASRLGEWRPDPELFAHPALAGLTPLTIGPADENGYRRVFGHVSGWTTCHIGYSECVTPPREDDFAYFHVGEVELSDGSMLSVGNLTLGGRHADPKAAFRDAIEHYDDTGAGVSMVRAYPDEFGIAVAGVVAPGVSDAQLVQMRRSVLSGDWRRVGGRMRLVGALAVNTGGFPVPRYAFDAAGRQISLVAAGLVPQGVRTEESYEQVARRVFAEETQKAARRAEVAGLLADAFADELAELLAEAEL